MNDLITVSGVRGYTDNAGVAHLNLEDVARGLGFTQVAASGNEVVRWERVDRYLSDLGFIPTSGDGLKEAVKDCFSTSGERPEFIPENIFYRLSMKAKNEAAERFQALVADEILPSIRKHGMYATPQTIEQMLADPDVMIATLQALKEERRGRLVAETQVQQQAQIIAEMEPKVSYYDLVLRCKGTMTVSQIAKDYGESPQWLNTKLSELGIQYKQRGTWLLYQKYAKMGYTKSKTVACDGKYGYTYGHLQTTWTQKGRLFIYDALKAHGILPMIERDDDVA